MGQRERSEDHWKVIFASVFFLFFLAVRYSTCKHAFRKESTIKRSVDDFELFDGQRQKSTRIIWFLLSPWSGFCRVQKRWPKTQLGMGCFSSEIAVFLYNWFVLAWVLPDSFAFSSKLFSLLKCLKLKRAPSYFANGIDLCYRLSLLFELVTAFTSSLWSGGICCCLIISRHRCFTIAPSYLFLQLLSTTREYEG